MRRGATPSAGGLEQLIRHQNGDRRLACVRPDVADVHIAPREIDEVLYQHPAVLEAAVVGVPDDYRGETVKAFVALSAEYKNKVSPEELISFCKEKLAAFKYPRIVEIIDEVPKTPTGKFLRRELRER